MKLLIRFAVNGFGRIGRAVVRQWMQMEASTTFELMAVNFIVLIEKCT